MRHTVRLDIGEPQERVAELFSDPRKSTQWMRDIERYVPGEGEPGATGSTFRLVPKDGKPEFQVTVVLRKFPSELRLILDAPTVSVAVKATFVALPGDRTLLVSEETFTFKTARDRLMGFLSRPAIAKAHKEQMRAFKRFAESRL